jgi:integrase
VDEKLTKAKAERNGGLLFDAGALTLAEYMDRWLRESPATGCGPRPTRITRV